MKRITSDLVIDSDEFLGVVTRALHTVYGPLLLDIEDAVLHPVYRSQRAARLTVYEAVKQQLMK